MGKRILIFNLVYYAVIFLLIKLGQADPGSSLGYGYFIIGFWIVTAALLVFFLIRRIIRPESFLQKIGIFTATPVLSYGVISLIIFFNANGGSEWYFEKGGHQYKAIKIYYKETPNMKRIEYWRKTYLSSPWQKDSLWLYFSETGDTIKKVKYRDDMEVK